MKVNVNYLLVIYQAVRTYSRNGYGKKSKYKSEIKKKYETIKTPGNY